MELSLSENRVDELDAVVKRAQHGSHQAFTELVRLYQRDVRALVWRHLGKGPSADDVAQEVFVHAYRNIATFSGTGSIRAWLLGITRNLVFSYLRQKTRQRSVTLADFVDELQLAESDENPLDAEYELRQLTTLRGCVDRLNEDQRRIVDLFYFEDVPAAVIARQMERKPGTIRMSLLRIRELLRRCVEQHSRTAESP